MTSVAASKSEPESLDTRRVHKAPSVVRVVEDPKSGLESKRIALPSTPLSGELAQAWLSWQCRMVAGLIQGGVFVPSSRGPAGQLIAAWPNKLAEEARLGEAAGRALEEGHGVLCSREHYGPDEVRTCDLIACPLMVNDQPVGAVAVMISTRSVAQQRAVLQLLQWGGLWIETLVRQQVATQREIAGSTTASLGAILSQDSVHAAAIEAVNRLADKYRCERVSLGLRKGLRIALQALSHVARFDSRTQLVRAIEAAMEEAVDQAVCIVRPNLPNQEIAISRAHAELSEQHGSGAVCTVPLPCESGHIGAITLERAGDKPFDPETVVACQSLASMVGPILAMKQREERPMLFKGIDSVRRLLITLCGPAQLKLKSLLFLLALLVALLAFVDGSYKVTAPATIQGEVRQLLVAPQDGFIERADIRAGDLVEKGQLIAALDESVHRLEVQKWASQKSKADKAYQEALAKRDRIELSLLRAEIEQLDAELRLAEDKLARTRLEAPFEGVVVSGDLSQSLGAPVETGQVLFEVAPLNRYRVVVEVDEHDVADLEPGLSGQLVVAAFPRKPFAVSVQRVVPVAVTGEGRNFFRVEATLDQPTQLLRPGMSGVAKIEIATRKLLWIWTHDLVERLRLWAWSLRLW